MTISAIAGGMAGMAEKNNIGKVGKVKVQKTLTSGKVTVFVDHRERASNVGRILDRKDISVREVQLEVADFVISDRIAIERKTVPDLLNSVINQRLFDQLARLSESYERPVLIIEGDPEELYTARDMHENTIRGVLSSVAIDYGVPIIWTENAMETAAMVYWIAYREQKMDKREPQIRACKRTAERPKMQEFLVAGLPNINSKMSRRLLEHFRTPREIFSASEERLMEVEGMGREKVRKVFDLLNCDYEVRHEGQGDAAYTDEGNEKSEQDKDDNGRGGSDNND